MVVGVAYGGGLDMGYKAGSQARGGGRGGGWGMKLREGFILLRLH